MVSFAHPWAFWSLGAIAIVVIIWLIRPKPKDVAIPSLLFLMKQQGTAQRATFFRRFSSNMLFYLQLAGITLLAIALISPLFNVAYDSAGGATVIVLDASASMQTQEGAATRFDLAARAAKRAVKGKTSIILAQSRPVLVLEAGDESKAKDILSVLAAKDTRSNIGDAMVYAKDIIGSQGRIVVISDFAFTEGPDPQVVKAVIEAKGPVVDFVKVGSPKDNVGIVDLSISRLETKVYVKNFGDAEEAITLEYDNQFSAARKRVSRTLLARSIEPFTFESGGGVTTIRILDDDALKADNAAFISNPQSTSLQALLIANRPSPFVKTALEALGNIRVDAVEPAGVTTANIEDGKYEIFILGDIDANDADNLRSFNTLIPSIREEAEDGKSVVILASDALSRIDYAGLLPIIPDGKGSDARFVTTIVNTVTQDIEFGGADEHMQVRGLDGATVLVRTANGTPIIAYDDIGAGKSVYYGILDTKSDFKSSPSYPIFWNQLVNFLTGAEDINNFNFKSGKLIAFPAEQRIDTPRGTVTTSRTILDEAGIYSYNGKQYAVNLLSEEESDIARDIAMDETASASAYTPRPVERRKDMNVEIPLIIMILLLLAAEFAWTKWSGDL